MLKKSTRKNLSKEQISEQMATERKIAHIKEVARKTFPFIENMETVYDAQTTVNAFGGFIAAEVEKKVADIKLSELSIDFSTEEDGTIKTAILELFELFKDEPAQELSETMERLGTTLQAYVSGNAMKEKMNIKADDVITK